MFIIELTYIKSLEYVEKYLAEHRNFLEDGYKNNYFVASGPQNPRTGGIVISQLKNRDQLEAILKKDPFSIHEIADYRVIEFNPVKYHKNFSSFIDSED
jgi:uncharacterized protein YciI